MKKYYRVMLGKQSIYAATCFAEGFIGADFEIPQDLSADLTDDYRAFNAKYRPIFWRNTQTKPRLARASLAAFCGRYQRELKRVTSCCARMGLAHIVGGHPQHRLLPLSGQLQAA
jgi:hypothetical protein